MYPLAKWHRERWNETAEKGVSFLAHIEDNLPVLREALEDSRNDEAFIANLLLKAAPAIDTELADDMQGYLRSLARRV
jgi:nitrate reductase assembly molybdenum cofactor insertion protein NarJ